MPQRAPATIGVPLPALSDEAAVEVYLLIESLFLLVERNYGDQIQRRFDSMNAREVVEAHDPQALDDPPP